MPDRLAKRKFRDSDVVGELINVPVACEVYLRDSSAEMIRFAATLRQEVKVKPTFSLTISILIRGLPVLALTLTLVV